jgi:hypothetical protein
MPPLGSVHKSRITYGDVTEESSSMELYNGAITAVSIAGFLTNFGALQTATDAITLGTRRSQSWIGDLTTVSNLWPTDKNAHRENKLLVTYRDDVTEEEFILTIPTVDGEQLNFVPGGGDAVQFSGLGASANIVNWVTAFEAIARTPRSDVNSVTVVGMRFVGRNI